MGRVSTSSRYPVIKGCLDFLDAIPTRSMRASREIPQKIFLECGVWVGDCSCDLGAAESCLAAQKIAGAAAYRRKWCTSGAITPLRSKSVQNSRRQRYSRANHLRRVRLWLVVRATDRRSTQSGRRHTCTEGGRPGLRPGGRCWRRARRGRRS